MIKPPSLRVPCIADVAPEVLDELEDDLDQFASLLPFKCNDYEVTGSAARGTWGFHSDLDINFASDDRDESLRLWRENKDGQSSKALLFWRSLWVKWGIKFQFRIEATTVKTKLFKSCYSLKERTHYHPEATQRVDEWPDGTVTPRIDPPRVRPMRLGFSWFDEDSNQHINEDPYPREEVERWARRYGENFQRLGETEETAYLTR